MSEKRKNPIKASENLGLNPSHKGEDDPEKSQNNLHLIYLIFLNKIFTIVGILKEKNIKGMTIGLAMNSVYYYQKEKRWRDL